VVVELGGTFRLGTAGIGILLLVLPLERVTVGRAEGVELVVRLLHDALKLVLEVQQHQRVTPAPPPLAPPALPPHLGSTSSIQQEVVELLVSQLQ
jgi:hypothetical protein